MKVNLLSEAVGHCRSLRYDLFYTACLFGLIVRSDVYPVTLPEGVVLHTSTALRVRRRTATRAGSRADSLASWEIKRNK